MFDESPSSLLRQPGSTPKSVQLFAQLDAHTDSNFFTGFSGDLRDGGLFVATYEPLDVGQPVRVDVSLPGGRFAAVQGYVAWHRDPAHGRVDLSPGVGVVLQAVDRETEILIRAFMGLREPSFVDPDVLSRDASPHRNASAMPPPLDAFPDPFGGPAEPPEAADENADPELTAEPSEAPKPAQAETAETAEAEQPCAARTTEAGGTEASDATVAEAAPAPPTDPAAAAKTSDGQQADDRGKRSKKRRGKRGKKKRR